MTYDDNDPTHSLTVAGGDLTVTGALTLTNGVVFTGSNTLFHNGSLTRTNGYVDGTVGHSYAATGSYTFPVGQAGFAPVTANVTSLGTTPSTLTARSVDTPLAGFDPAKTISRYWELSETGDLTADLSFGYLAGDVNGNEADYRVYRFDGTKTNFCPAGPCVNTGTHVAGPAVGVTAFSQWTVGELQVVVPPFGSIQGKAWASNGQGLRGLTVILSGGDLAQPLMASTSSYGYFSFEGLTGGQTYTVTIQPKRFHFPSNTQNVTILNDTNTVSFISNP